MTERPPPLAGTGRDASLHARLASRQSTAELARKQQKAGQRGVWTQEDIDLAVRKARGTAATVEFD